MTTEPVSKDEVAAALQTGRELGPEYEDAVAASLAERLDRTVEQRVRAELARRDAAPAVPPAGTAPNRRGGHSTAMGISVFFSLLFAAPASPALLDQAGLPGLIVLWTAIVLINLIVAVTGRQR